MSTKRGAVAESIVCTAALTRGRDVYFPARGLSPAHDLIMSGADGKLYKVQVKRAHIRVRGASRTLRVNITDSQGRPYLSNEVDLISIVDVETRRVWMIPLAKLGQQKTLSLTSGKYDRWLL